VLGSFSLTGFILKIPAFNMLQILWVIQLAFFVNVGQSPSFHKYPYTQLYHIINDKLYIIPQAIQKVQYITGIHSESA
jgi:hypothetical protein